MPAVILIHYLQQNLFLCIKKYSVHTVKWLVLKKATSHRDHAKVNSIGDHCTPADLSDLVKLSYSCHGKWT